MELGLSKIGVKFVFFFILAHQTGSFFKLSFCTLKKQNQLKQPTENHNQVIKPQTINSLNTMTQHLIRLNDESYFDPRNAGVLKSFTHGRICCVTVQYCARSSTGLNPHRFSAVTLRKQCCTVLGSGPKIGGPTMDRYRQAVLLAPVY